MAVIPQVWFDSREQSPDGSPIYHPGERVGGSLSLVPEKSAKTRGVQLWIGCLIHGSGSSESIELFPEQFIHEGHLEAGLPIQGDFEVFLPENAPLSYQGRRIKFDWVVTVRVDIPIWPDKRYNLPFTVAPRKR